MEAAAVHQSESSQMGMIDLELTQMSEISQLLKEEAWEVKEVDLEEISGHKILEIQKLQAHYQHVVDYSLERNFVESS